MVAATVGVAAMAATLVGHAVVIAAGAKPQEAASVGGLFILMSHANSSAPAWVT